MKFRELKAKLDSMTDQQLDWPVVIFEGDNEQGNELDCVEESGEDIYWYDGECYGVKIDAEQATIDDDSITMDDFQIIPKGTITLHYSLSEIQMP